MGFAQRAAFANAPAWRPEPDETLVPGDDYAEVIGFREGHTDEYGSYPVIIYTHKSFEKAHGNPFVAFHAFHTIARERLAELGTKVGSRQNILVGAKRMNNAGDKEYVPYFIEDADHVVKDKADDGVMPQF